ncbi:glycosyltransferase involved in cell wall biosynthesis [Microbacteriaceae bacterium SG_E_30_P1]|uniref:D-inositol 3-phosphate glycosyltransferase n=1 Tax=Antiquaquibacter oligotrophicus TaxID=2880260 RepID=A0ABT6KM67_9MICO|nr:glycosyltransferase [Antiquaquibacter oligotrophicus]MDH6181108.1 glycosyltransferase involved in cell wall biosynthesis [Antiquaquibacter oligotrophicus]UDF13194.1 glycosyltransferase [Antiquaquibacter oligotrophicus]
MADISRRTFDENSPRLRVLIGADTFAPEINGAASFIARLAAGLVIRGHDVHIMAPSYDGRLGAIEEVHEGQRMTVHRVRSWRWYPHPTFRFLLPWRVKAESARILDLVKPDVIHFQSHIVVGRGLTIEGAKRGIRLIGTNHFMPENLLDHAIIIPPFLRRWAIRRAWAAADRSFSRAERVSTPTQKAAEYLEKNTSIRGVLAISCGIDAHNYVPSFDPADENLIVFLGRIVDEKQIDKLIRAFAKLSPELNAKLQIMGTGDQEHRLKTLASQLRVADRVRFEGRVTDEFIRDSLTKAKVFAMPSIAELQSISTMEAMASGLPIVAADAMALPHLVHDGENGFLFTPGNVDELAEKLTRVLTMPQDELERFKRESLSIVEAHDIQRTLNTFEALYRGEPV